MFIQIRRGGYLRPIFNMENVMKSVLNPVLALASFCLVAAPMAQATNLFNPQGPSPTTALDGASIRLDGTLNDTNGNSQPWTAELYAGAGQCLRLFVTSTAFDSELTVVAPNGTVYRDDDSGGSLRPLVKVASAPIRGWYTVQVASYSGAPTNANFTLLYGTYTAGNPNCANGTTPVFSNENGMRQTKDNSVLGTTPKGPNEP